VILAINFDLLDLAWPLKTVCYIQHLKLRLCDYLCLLSFRVNIIIKNHLVTVDEVIQPGESPIIYRAVFEGFEIEK